ncbi:hypothetical protein FAM14222p2_001385 [Propionibacterium freudenreichii]
MLDDADLIGRARDVAAAALSTTALESLDPGLQDMVKAAQLNAGRRLDGARLSRAPLAGVRTSRGPVCSRGSV